LRPGCACVPQFGRHCASLVLARTACDDPHCNAVGLTQLRGSEPAGDGPAAHRSGFGAGRCAAAVPRPAVCFWSARRHPPAANLPSPC